jgi:hypothetical protein
MGFACNRAFSCQASQPDAVSVNIDLVLRDFRWLSLASPVLVKLDDPLVSPFQIPLIGDTDPVFAGQHTVVALQQQRLGLDVFLLSSQARTEQAHGSGSLPGVWLGSIRRLQSFSRHRLAQRKFPLRKVSASTL